MTSEVLRVGTRIYGREHSVAASGGDEIPSRMCMISLILCALMISSCCSKKVFGFISGPGSDSRWALVYLESYEGRF